MIIGRVYGSVVSTHKLEGLVGYKFMLVQCIENKKNILEEDVCQLKLVKAYNL